MTVASLKESESGPRVAEWISRLEKARGPRSSVRDLYLGNHWSIVRSLVPNKDGLDVRVWVASAGYGILPIDAEIHSYSATFSTGRDSVGDGIAGQIWWDALSKWKRVNTPIRSIAQLARQSRQTPLLIAASATYVGALSEDLAEAGRRLTPKKLGIISAGFRRDGELQPFMVPADARFKQTLRGPMHSLNASILRYAILKSRHWYPEIDQLRKQFKKELESMSADEQINRTRRTDEEIVAFIRAEIGASPSVARSQLLRKLRDSGFACEQARFKQLYVGVLESQ
jgi:hypothetical protein